MIRRLRQLTIHPSLITVDGSGGAIHFIEEVKKAMDFLGETKVEELRAKRMAIAVARCLTENGSKAADENDDDGSCPVCMEVSSSSFRPSSREWLTCSLLEVITPGSGVALGCLHVFCYPCAEEVLNGPAVEVDVDDRRLKKDERPCPKYVSFASATELLRADITLLFLAVEPPSPQRLCSILTFLNQLRRPSKRKLKWRTQSSSMGSPKTSCPLSRNWSNALGIASRTSRQSQSQASIPTQERRQEAETRQEDEARQEDETRKEEAKARFHASSCRPVQQGLNCSCWYHAVF